jgi:DNA-binding MarR family transcriptional regulator
VVSGVQYVLPIVLTSALSSRVEHLDFRVLAALLTRLNYDRFLPVERSDIARAVRSKPGRVGAALRRLRVAGFLIRGAKDGNSFTYRLPRTSEMPGRVPQTARVYPPQGH